MEKIDATVRRALQGAGVPDAGQLAELTASWPATVGDAIARAAWPQRVSRDGTLVVATCSATWAFELGRMASEILDKIRAAHPHGAPAALKFVPGPVPEPPAPLSPRRATTGLEIAPEEEAEAARLSAVIGDDELRAAVARAVAASLARARADRVF
jgi:hypothetical protein